MFLMLFIFLFVYKSLHFHDFRSCEILIVYDSLLLTDGISVGTSD